jgi:adenine-specific DNA-methyltransferase
VQVACDLFAGTTRVGQALKQLGIHVVSNDLAAYSEVLGRCYVEADADAVSADEVEQLLAELGALPPESGYFTDTFCVRSRFFKPENGRRIDAIRRGIDRLDLDEPLRSIALVSLMEAADRVDSTTGLQMAYLKRWAPRAHRPLELRAPVLLVGTGTVFRADGNALVRRLPEVDLLYLDPPYNQHSYLANYHIWETLVRNDAPETYGKACKRLDCRSRKSLYNSRSACFDALADVVRSARARFLVVSFSNEGFIGREELEELLTERGEVVRLDIPYRRYVGAQIGIHNLRGERVGRVSHLKNVEHLFVAGDGVADLMHQSHAVGAPI